MHKKFLVLFAALVLVAGMSFGQDIQTFNFSATVEPYVEVNPTYANVNLSANQAGLVPGTAASTGTSKHWAWSPGYEVAYANCPFKITFTGDNVAGDELPILARQEVDGNGYDRLRTAIVFWYYIAGNVIEANVQFNQMWKNPNTWFGNPASLSTPHSGDVRCVLALDAKLPHLSPDFGNPNTWYQSADAGLYTCTVVATYAVI